MKKEHSTLKSSAYSGNDKSNVSNERKKRGLNKALSLLFISDYEEKER